MSYLNAASVDYCERCRCKTLHIPLPSGERVCEWHLPEVPEPELVPPPAPARPREERRP